MNTDCQDNNLPLILLGANKASLKDLLQKVGVPERQINMRLAQLWNLLYVRGIRDIAEATTLPQSLRQQLAEQSVLRRLKIAQRQIARDGTRKWLFTLPDGNLIETVFIPEKTRGTLCVSSQIGCTLNCSFCHTGTQKLVRNLTAEEIVQQLLIARDELDDWGKSADGRKITNIVFMGMGEPLYNFDNVKDACHILMAEDGLSIGKRRITLSTSGIVPLIADIGHKIGCNLAISLHAPNDDLRNVLVPINKKYPLEMLLQACRDYPGLRAARRITFEYVMLQEVNDHISHAKALVHCLHGIPAKMNLIPFNVWPGSHYQPSTPERIEAFSQILLKAGYPCSVRRPRGDDIIAACGQLKSASQPIPKRRKIAQATPAMETIPS